MFHIKDGLKQGDALSSLLFNFASHYAIRSVHVNQEGLKLNGTRHLFVYADYVNILGGGLQTIQKNTDALVVACKETGPDVDADKIKYVVMSRDQNAGRSCNVKTVNGFFESVEQFKYLRTTLTNQNSIQKEMNSRLKSGNACYHSVHNLLSSSLVSRNVNIKIYRTVILSVVLCGCET